MLGLELAISIEKSLNLAMREARSASKSDHSREARNSFRKLYREKIKLKKMNYNKKSIETAKNKTKAMWNIVNQNRNTYSNTCDETCDITSNSFNTFLRALLLRLPPAILILMLTLKIL
jgi:hypothetical protein